MKFVETQVTPEMAKDFLSGNHRNRNLDKRRIDLYAQEIIQGRWRITSECIAIADDGRIVDGQHRLHAVIRAGRTIDVTVCYGADPDTFGVINVGKPRTGNDIWHIAGHKSTNAAAIAKLVYLYENNRSDLDWHNRGRVGADTILRWCQHNGYMDIISRASYRERDFRTQIKKVGACIGASMVLTEIHGGQDFMVDTTYDIVYKPVVTCLRLEEGMPSYILNRMLNRRDEKEQRLTGNPFQTGISGLNIHRSRLAILLRIITDTYRNIERRQPYKFEFSVMPEIGALLPFSSPSEARSSDGAYCSK